MLAFFVVAIGILGLATWYLGSRLGASVPDALKGPMWILLVLGVLIQPLSFVLIRFDSIGSPGLVAAFQWAAYLGMGLFSLLFAFTFAVDVGLLAARVANAGVTWAGHDSLLPTDPGRRSFLLGALHLGVVGLTAFIATVGFREARRLARVVEVEIRVPGLPAALEGFRIAQISDIHVGPTIGGDYLRGIVSRVNELGADLVAVTGDLVDGSVRALLEDVAPLAELRATHGAFFVTGNHEYYSGVEPWLAEVRRLGLRTLVNEHVVLDHKGATMLVAGVTDLSAGRMMPEHESDPAAACKGAPEACGFRLLLAHQPRSAFAAVPHGFQLMLAGHTHGGQYFPWNLVIPLVQPFSSGLHKLEQMWIYTSRGTGYWGPPIRFGAPSEITLLRLVTA